MYNWIFAIHSEVSITIQLLSHIVVCVCLCMCACLCACVCAVRQQDFYLFLVFGDSISFCSSVLVRTQRAAQPGL